MRPSQPKTHPAKGRSKKTNESHVGSRRQENFFPFPHMLVAGNHEHVPYSTGFNRRSSASQGAGTAIAVGDRRTGLVLDSTPGAGISYIFWRNQASDPYLFASKATGLAYVRGKRDFDSVTESEVKGRKYTGTSACPPK
jgi:hypothetical protein